MSIAVDPRKMFEAAAAYRWQDDFAPKETSKRTPVAETGTEAPTGKVNS